MSGFNRIAQIAVLPVLIGTALVGVRLFAVAEAPPPRFEIGTTTEPTFTIGPIEGLTTTWHWAPRSTSIPLGTIAHLFQPASPDATVNWTGADEVARDDQGSYALCPLVLPGIAMVQVEVIPAHGGDAFSSQSRFNVVDIDVEQITVSAIDVWVDSIEIDEDLPQDEINEQTMDYFFGLSIAALRDLGDGQYRTSVNRMVQMSVEVDPPGFAPLIEWRFDGEPVPPPPAVPGGSLGIDTADGMGTSEQWRFLDIGNHFVEVGPWLNPEQIEIETYSVTITSHTSGEDSIPEGEPVLFIAETDPPGYENDITWLSSTKDGTAEPILGEGPIFIAEFNDTWDSNGFQWLGVKADNTIFNQDQKNKKFNPPPKCVAPYKTFGNPVYLFSGENTESAVHLWIEGRGRDVVWECKYRSRFGLDTVQGNGWDFTYNIRIEPSGDNFVLLEGNARLDVYLLQPDGTWAVNEFFRVLSQNEDGSYTLTFADTSTWSFHPFDGNPQQGKIASSVDRNRNTISFDYDDAGRLATITDTLDRDIEIAYNDHGFIESVTDFADRQVRYEYYQDSDEGGSFGDLKSARTPIVTGTPNQNDFPEGKTTTYTYSTGFDDERLNHNLLTITDPKGQTYVTNTYGNSGFSFDRVVRQVWGDPGDIIDFVYMPVEPAEQNNFAVSKVILNDRVGNVKEFFIDVGNRTVIFREYTGRWDPDQPTPDPTAGPDFPKLRPGDPDFFETRWEYNEDSLPTRIDHPNGNVIMNVQEFDLDPNAPRRSRANLREMHRLPGTHMPPGDQTEIVELYEYDTDFGGCCSFNFVTRHVDGRGNETLHEYDASGNRLHTQHRIPSIIEDFQYNEFGQMTKHILPDNGSDCRRVDVYTYYDTGPQMGYRHQKIIDASTDDSCPGEHFALTTAYEYDLVGHVIRVTDPRGHDTQYIVNELDQLVREISREVELPRHGDNPQPFRYERDTFYDANDNVVRVDIQNLDRVGDVPNDNTHFSMIYDYEILNYRIGMAQEFGDADLENHILEICDIPVGDFDQFIVTEYKYDANRNRTLVRSGEATNGNQPTNLVRTLYDERDLVFREIRAEGDPDQSTTQYDYDSNRNHKRSSQGLEGTPRITTNTYDGYDRMVSSTDPMGNVIESHYDPNSNVGGNREPGEPNPFGTLVSGELIDVQGSAGNIRLSQMTYVYDEMDRRTRAIVEFFETETQDPIGDGQSVTETQYTDNSQVNQVTNDNGHAMNMVYDTANRVLTVMDANDNTVTYQYDQNSNVTSVLEVEKNDLPHQPDEQFTTTGEYDNLDRLISTTDNVGNTNHFAYDSRHNQTLMTDALGNVVRYAYDGINRLIATTRELTDTGDGDGDVIDNITTTQVWDDTSRLVEQADDNGNATTYTYDSLNRMVAEVYADETVHSYTYDVHDNRLTMTDANGSVATSIYDLLDRLKFTTIDPAPGVIGTTHESYHYDGLSRLVIAKDNDSGVFRSHDSLSGVIRETLNGHMTQCVYDGVGNQTQCTYPGGRTITCTFDDLERKQTISDAGGLVGEYHYVGPGRVARREYGNGTQTDYTYDGITGMPNEPGDFGVKRIVQTTHLKIAGGTIIDDRTYTWDRMFNKTQRKDVREGGPQLTHDYTYDSIYRLLRTVATDPIRNVLRDEQYDLDGVGNREEVVGGNKPGQYFLDPTLPEPADFQMNQYTQTPFDGRTYDQNGNLIELIDAGDPPPMATVQYDYRNQMASYVDPFTGVMAEYAYDALGRRIQKDVNGEVTRYFYDGWQVVEEHNEFNATQATYIYGLYIDEVLNMQRGGSDFFYHTDDLYNVMAITDDTGAVADNGNERYEYADYGLPIDPSTLDPIEGDPSAIGNPYLFTGRRYDPETGWYYYRTRYLDPNAGRFTTRDTIGIWTDSWSLGNGFVYVGNNPFARQDPLGYGIADDLEKIRDALVSLKDILNIFQREDYYGVQTEHSVKATSAKCETTWYGGYDCEGDCECEFTITRTFCSIRRKYNFLISLFGTYTVFHLTETVVTTEGWSIPMINCTKAKCIKECATAAGVKAKEEFPDWKRELGKEQCKIVAEAFAKLKPK